MNLSEGFYIIKLIHYIISTTFLLIAAIIIFRSVKGVRGKIEYTTIDKVLSSVFMVNLYLQLIFGLILFSNLGSALGYDYVNADGTVKIISKRFWPVEHIVLMIFALLIANLGFIFSNTTRENKLKFKKVLIYYSLSILMIAYSLSSIYLF